MKYLLSIILITVTAIAMAQQTAKYETSKDEKTGNLTFKGPLTFNDLNNEPTFDWAKSGYEEYRPDADKISYLKNICRNTACWCLWVLGAMTHII